MKFVAHSSSLCLCAPYVKAACFLKLLQGAKLLQQSAKLPEQRQFFFLFLKKTFWIFFWLLKPRKNKEEKGRKKKILPSSLFFYFHFSSCDFGFFFLLGFFPSC